MAISKQTHRKKQPLSGGCVLKPYEWALNELIKEQPPSGGCVLKRIIAIDFLCGIMQPPSGGCVLKPNPNIARQYERKPAAAFGRLCVETHHAPLLSSALLGQPPSGGCVLKQAQ